jgi:hypothetical protein
MSVLKVAVASVLALSLVLGLALPALADSGKPLPWTEDFQARIVKGEVTYVDEANQEYFKVQSGEDEIRIRVDEDTKYFVLNAPGRIAPMLEQFRIRNQAEVNAQAEQGVGMCPQNRVRAGALVQNQARLEVQNQLAQTETVPLPEPQPARVRVQEHLVQTESVPLGEPQPARVRAQNQMVQMVTFPLPEPQPVSRPLGEKAEFSDIEIGDRVMVWIANGENLAKWVLIIKPAVRAHVGGTITELSSETITIAPDDGEAVTLRYNQDTVFVLSGFTSVEEGQLARAVYDREHMLAKKVAVHLPSD